MAPGLQELLTTLRSRVDRYLPVVLESAGGPPRLREAMAYGLLAPGKRLRPILVMLAASACGGSHESALPSAAAAEMIHAYSLIHDDLPAMDDDDLRRGRPTCHRQFDEATAILAGDGLLTLAFQVIAQNYPPPVAAECTRVLALAAGAAGMVGGQMADLQAEGAAEVNAGQLEAIHAAKTGALFRGCLQMGAAVAQNVSTEGFKALDEFGRAFGLVFQITDDLLDVDGDAEQVGKRVGKDAARGKLTYPGLLGIEESRRRAAALVGQAVQAAQSFGPAGEPLAALAGYLLDRDR